MPPATARGHVSSEFWQFEPTAVTSSAAELHIKKLFSVCGREGEREGRDRTAAVSRGRADRPRPLHEVSAPPAAAEI